jgi:hypothetical protein
MRLVGLIPDQSSLIRHSPANLGSFRHFDLAPTPDPLRARVNRHNPIHFHVLGSLRKKASPAPCTPAFHLLPPISCLLSPAFGPFPTKCTIVEWQWVRWFRSPICGNDMARRTRFAASVSKLRRGKSSDCWDRMALGRRLRSNASSDYGRPTGGRFELA